jgi:hypothetical protein
VANRMEDIFQSSAECPRLEELLAALEGDLGLESKRTCEDHVTHCVRCSAEIGLFRRFESAQPARDERQPVAAIVAQLKKNSPAKPTAWWLSMWRVLWQGRILMPASVALAALAILVTINMEKSPVLHEPSAPGESDVVRSGRLVVTGPAGDMRQAPHELQWQPLRGATRYQVRLLEVDKTPLWHASVTASSAVLPPEIVARITPMKTLLWEVTALDDAGRPVASSGIQTFRLLRPASK